MCLLSLFGTVTEWEITVFLPLATYRINKYNKTKLLQNRQELHCFYTQRAVPVYPIQLKNM